MQSMNAGSESLPMAWKLRDRWHAIVGDNDARAELKEWAAAGFAPRDARVWQRHLEFSGFGESEPTPAAAAARAEQWREAGFDPFRAGWYENLGADPVEAKTWVDSLAPVLPPSSDVDLEAPAWRSVGFDPDEAGRWVAAMGQWEPSPLDLPPGPVGGGTASETARRFADAGIGTDEAGAWQRVLRAATSHEAASAAGGGLAFAVDSPRFRSFASEAVSWHREGFTPGEAAEWTTRLTVPRLNARSSDWIGAGGVQTELEDAARYLPPVAAQWKAMGCSPSDAVRYYQRGYRDPGEVVPDQETTQAVARTDLTRRRTEPAQEPVPLAFRSGFYSQREWRVNAEDGGLDPIPQWEQDRSRYYEVLESRGVDVEELIEAELVDPTPRNWAVELDGLGSRPGVVVIDPAATRLLSQLPETDAAVSGSNLLADLENLDRGKAASALESGIDLDEPF